MSDCRTCAQLRAERDAARAICQEDLNMRLLIGDGCDCETNEDGICLAHAILAALALVPEEETT